MPRRAYARVKCPYWVRLGRNSIICGGFEKGQCSVQRFDNESHRDEWLQKYCERENSGKPRCPLARSLDKVYEEKGL